MADEILDVKPIILDENLLSILSPSIFNPTSERLRSRAESYINNENAYIFAYRENDKYLGIVVFEIAGHSAKILDIAVETTHRSKGIGSCLIDFVFKEFGVTHIYAETDDDAIGFYKKYGFIVLETFFKFDTMRYKCVCTNPATEGTEKQWTY